MEEFKQKVTKALSKMSTLQTDLTMVKAEVTKLETIKEKILGGEERHRRLAGREN